MELLHKLRVGYCFTGSFCTFSKAIASMRGLKELGCDIVPVMSFNAGSMNTRFGTAREHIEVIERIAGRKVIMTIEDAEPIGPKNMTDIMVIAPCTGNTIAKLSASVTDTPVTMAVKSHLRGERPVIIAISTNDALAGSLKNIGLLLNRRHYYFVPFYQDDPIKKPMSLVADLDKLPDTILSALGGKQLQPILKRG